MQDGNEQTGLLARYWKSITVSVVAFSALLGSVDAFLNQGRSVICTTADLLGQAESVAICHDESSESPGDALAQIEALKAREATLSAGQLAVLNRLEKHFVDQTLAELQELAGITDLPPDATAAADTRMAIRETVESGEPEERAALAEIADGDVSGGIQKLVEQARSVDQESLQKWRRIGRLAYHVDTATALAAYQKVWAHDSADIRDVVYLGRLYLRSGALSNAHQTYTLAMENLPDLTQRERSVLLNEIGNVLMAQGDLDQALTAYQEDMGIAARLAASDASNMGWQRDLSVSHIKIGDVMVARGDLDGALTAYREAMDIAAHLAASDASNMGWQRDLSVAHAKIGDVLKVQGDLDGALAAYREDMRITMRLVASDADNMGWQRDLSVSHIKIGDMIEAQGDLAGALTAYREAMGIRARLAASDASNMGWQRDLSVSHEKIGNVLEVQGDLAGAIAAYEESLPIARGLAERVPDHPQFQSDIAITERRLAELRAQSHQQ